MKKFDHTYNYFYIFLMHGLTELEVFLCHFQEIYCFSSLFSKIIAVLWLPIYVSIFSSSAYFEFSCFYLLDITIIMQNSPKPHVTANAKSQCHILSSFRTWRRVSPLEPSNLLTPSLSFSLSSDMQLYGGLNHGRGFDRSAIKKQSPPS